MRLQLRIGGNPGLTPGGRHCEIKLGDLGFSADKAEYLSLSGICQPERAAVMALAFKMQAAINSALDSFEDGNSAEAERTLLAIQGDIVREIEAAKEASK